MWKISEKLSKTLSWEAVWQKSTRGRYQGTETRFTVTPKPTSSCKDYSPLPVMQHYGLHFPASPFVLCISEWPHSLQLSESSDLNSNPNPPLGRSRFHPGPRGMVPWGKAATDRGQPSEPENRSTNISAEEAHKQRVALPSLAMLEIRLFLGKKCTVLFLFKFKPRISKAQLTYTRLGVIQSSKSQVTEQGKSCRCTMAWSIIWFLNGRKWSQKKLPTYFLWAKASWLRYRAVL